MSDALRIGILGTAKIARSFVAGVKPSAEVAVTAVASRDALKAQAFAAEFGIARACGDYESLLTAPDVDALYIPLPNGLHAAWAARALEAGKHVLCEKPLCPSAREAEALYRLARTCRRHLAEGFPYLAQPQTQRMRELLRDGAIGSVRHIQASFSFTLRETHNVRLSTELAGGALLDLGTYLVSLVRIIAGSAPTEVQASARYEREGGVDRSFFGTLRFAQGLSAQLACSFDAALHRQALIVGSDGLIETTFRNHTSEQLPGDLLLTRGADAGAVRQVLKCGAVNGFRAEADSFAQLVRGTGPWSGLTPEESIDVARMLERLGLSAREQRALPLDDANV